MSNDAALLRQYEAGPERLEALVREMSEDELGFTPGPPHWSAHEQVVHLADSDLVAAARIRHVLAEPGSTLVAFDQEVWAAEMDYAGQPVDAALAVFRAVRASTAALLARMPAEAWDRAGRHTEAGVQTVRDVVAHYVEHLEHHLGVIAKRRRQYAAR